MTHELMRYGGYRYLLYKRWDFAPNGRTEEQKEALDAGAALFKAANFHHWGTQPELVERVQKFLVESFASYRPSQYGERPSDVINALCWEVRNGAALIVRAAPAYIAHDGFVPARDDYAAYDRDIAERASSYAARSKAYSEDLKAYNKAIDDRIEWESRSALKPFRHIESVTEAGERNRAAWAALGGLASLGSAALSIVASSSSSSPSPSPSPSIEDDSLNLGDMSSTGAGSTPLGDAAPFEYVKSATGDDVMSMAARGFGESVQADCFYQYERDMNICNALAGMMGSGMRGLALCKQNAFQDYQTCRGF
jgi:hypothetical protein